MGSVGTGRDGGRVVTFETLQAIGTIIGSVLVVVAGGLGFHKLRNGKPAEPPQLQPPAPRAPQPSTPQLQGYPMAPPPAGLVDTAADTGRHEPPWMTDTQRNLPTPFGLTAGEMRQMAADLSKAARNAPATAADVDNAVEPLRKEVASFRKVFSDGLEGVRDDVQKLPCMLSPDGNCDRLDVPLTMPPRHPAASHLKRVKP